MQYILTEDEMQAVRDVRESLRELLRYLPSVECLQTTCTKIADEWSTFTGWDKKKPIPPEPWGCILTVKHEHYCDKCPVIQICPNKNKQWSK